MNIAQEQIKQLAEALKSERVSASCGLVMQNHPDPDHLIVFQESDGHVHQLLLGITYIGHYPKLLKR